MMNVKTNNKYRMPVIMACFMVLGIVLSEDTANAFDLKSSKYFPISGGYQYEYELEMSFGDSFSTGKNLTLTGLAGVYFANTLPSASDYFFIDTGAIKPNQVTWTAKQPLSSFNILPTFIVQSSLSGGNVNWSFNASGNQTSGKTFGPVPEPMTTLLGSGLALGFGGFLKRESSRKQKKFKEKISS